MRHPLCMIGRHTGQGDGGLMMYHCARCGGDYWQLIDMTFEGHLADALILAGESEKAQEFVRETLEKVAKPKRRRLRK